MIYFKTLNTDGSILDFGKAGKYMPNDSIEITQEEFENILEEFKQKGES